MVFFNGKVECAEVTRKIEETPELEFITKNDLICEIRSGIEGEYISR